MTGVLKSRLETAKGSFESIFSLSQKLDFEPGQYVTVTLPSLKNDPKGNSRIFSIVNPPYDNKILKILYRNTGSLYKNELLKMSLGNKIKISNPIGDFAPKPGKLIFLAAGIGIAPFMSMMPVNAEWFVTNSSKESAPYLNQIPKNANLFFTKTGKRLNLNDIKKTRSWQQANFYIAGPPEFVEDLEAQLIEAKISPNQINREAFDGE